MRMTSGSPIEILLIEDNPGDVELTRDMVERSKVRNVINNVSDGIQAMAYLRRTAPYGNAKRPDLILLDLNLPGKDGRAVLSEIKGDTQLKDIPVVVLTSSEAETDVLRSYQLHANCYISKPVDLAKFTNIIRSIEDFWLTVVKLPRRSG
ncbi:MAG TPA: response regulator [Terriglobales bacterium]|nr:response regulator [Terriglobales bacterium]HXY13091.1 response regulator [Terriglobales bacterium]